jgi:hypothetical protein
MQQRCERSEACPPHVIRGSDQWAPEGGPQGKTHNSTAQLGDPMNEATSQKKTHGPDQHCNMNLNLQVQRRKNEHKQTNRTEQAVSWARTGQG